MKIINSADLPEVGVSHNPRIKKKVFLGRDEIKRLMVFGEATFKPGQSVELHAHEDMAEVFFILSGKARFKINGEEVIATPGTYILVEPKEMHSQDNPFDEDVRWVYMGLQVD